MRLKRPGETPSFYEYAVTYVIRVSNKDLPSILNDFNFNSMKIPPYQRHIVWKYDEVEEFLQSNAILFGTAILARSDQDKYLTLIDGLQRFATATAILTTLFPLVLSPQPTKKSIARYFKKLANEVMSKEPIYSYNDQTLKNHTRQGIRTSYTKLSESVKLIINENLNKSETEIETFANQIHETFIKKQIAIDEYHGFEGTDQLIETFININSTGIDLTEVDLFRSMIIQQAENLGWTDDDIDYIENRFTETVITGPAKEAKVLIKNLYDAIKAENAKRNEKKKGETIVFETWDTLKKDDVDGLLDFITDMHDAASLVNDCPKNPYLYEILECGHMPFALTTWFFYKQKLNGCIPDFLDDTGHDTTCDLNLLLRAFYRRVIDGHINRIASIVSNFIQKCEEKTIPEIAFKIVQSTGGELDSNPEEDWLRINLRKAKTDKIRRIFNACLLPNRDECQNAFKPLVYGTKQKLWNIDHLIPKVSNTDQIIREEMNQIVNYAPLQSFLNKKIRETPCDHKLSNIGVYNDIKDLHPYIEWLCDEHYPKYKDNLKHPEYLVARSDPAIGDDRMNKIIELISDKL